MPVNPRSLRLTDRYRERLRRIRDRVERLAGELPAPGSELDDSRWVEATANALTQAQAEAVRVSGGYLTAFLTLETGERTSGPLLPAREFAGTSSDGRSNATALRSPVIGMLAAVREGVAPARQIGVQRARHVLEASLMFAARESLRQGMVEDDRIEGWQRAVQGTCGACLGSIAVEVTVELPSIPMMQHPNCQCVSEPVVTTRARQPGRIIERLAGNAIFQAMARHDQDAEFGEDKAEALRTGAIGLDALIGRHELRSDDDRELLHERSLEDARKGEVDARS